MSPRARRIAIVVAVLAAVQGGAIAIYFAVMRARAAPAPIEAKAVPAIRGEQMGGALVEHAWPSPRPRLVHFWATWCPPCMRELPSLLALAVAWRDRIDVVAIAVDDDWAEIAKFLGGSVPPEVLVETGGAATHRRLGVATLPDTFLVGRDGTVLARFHGARDWASPALRDQLAAHMPKR